MSVTNLVSPVVLENTVEEIEYPESDGKPMADNSKQFELITTIKDNLEILFKNDEQVFIAGDMLWYPVEGDNKKRVAPDTMVVFGRPKGHRGSYMQWKEANIAPQVVFEILSPGNTEREMSQKFSFYEVYGVEEYYLYDPDSGRLEGWQRQQNKLQSIPSMLGWQSPRLGVRFDKAGLDLVLYYPDGRRFLTALERDKKYEEVKAQAHQEATARVKEARARLKAEDAAKEAEIRAKKAEEQVKLLEAKLKAAGML